MKTKLQLFSTLRVTVYVINPLTGDPSPVTETFRQSRKAAEWYSLMKTDRSKWPYWDRHDRRYARALKVFQKYLP